MELKTFGNLVAARYKVILVVVVSTVVLALVYFLIVPPSYTARTTFYVSAQSGDSPTTAYQGSLLSEQRVVSYVQLATNTRVMSEVSQQLGLGLPAEKLADKVSASSQPDSVVIEVAVSDDQPEQSVRIANTIGKILPSLVASLEQPLSRSAQPPVLLRVVEPAQTPTEPSSPGLAILLTAGVLLGLFLGLIVALILHSIDSSLRAREELQDITGAAVIGDVPLDQDVSSARSLTSFRQESAFNEAFRQVRTNLQFVSVETPLRSILVTSALAGEGKTTVASNLSIGFASAGSKVLLVEGDLRRPAAASAMGLEGAVGLTTLLTGKARLDQVVQSWSSGAVDFLASGPLPPNPAEILSSRNMAALVEEFKTKYDVVVIDGAPCLPVADSIGLAPLVDGVVLVCRYNQTTRKQLASCVERLAFVSAKVVGTVFSMSPSRGRANYYGYGYQRNSNGQAGRAQDVIHDDGTVTLPATPKRRVHSERRHGRSTEAPD